MASGLDNDAEHILITEEFKLTRCSFIVYNKGTTFVAVFELVPLLTIPC